MHRAQHFGIRRQRQWLPPIETVLSKVFRNQSVVPLWLPLPEHLR